MIPSKSFVWTIDGTLTSITTPGQSRPESNGNEFLRLKDLNPTIECN